LTAAATCPHGDSQNLWHVSVDRNLPVLCGCCGSWYPHSPLRLSIQIGSWGLVGSVRPRLELSMSPFLNCLSVESNLLGTRYGLEGESQGIEFTEVGANGRGLTVGSSGSRRFGNGEIVQGRLIPRQGRFLQDRSRFFVFHSGLRGHSEDAQCSSVVESRCRRSCCRGCSTSNCGAGPLAVAVQARLRCRIGDPQVFSARSFLVVTFAYAFARFPGPPGDAAYVIPPDRPPVLDLCSTPTPASLFWV
jgi:hypothetical protein